MKKLTFYIAWFRTCCQRVGVYVHIYNACMLTALFIIEKGLPRSVIPFGIAGFLVIVLIIGSLDIAFGVYKAENRLVHENSPVIMEILKEVRGKNERD